ncbi:hypothetical protein J8J14_11060 [Roseomonas sp. SSH11]|uniref:Uncharacterized protein n=1 Tax=Pararoseomonas baculiformis TaxID=2820812 RepID=A0ABS4AE85_9PROT|nr:hypothetical protein [Pararoseomonas baculiformis]MBP0445318.1 hypothetical protein [Pararoseomonas baculiformis]
MKNAVFGALIAIAGALSLTPGAKAQDFGYGYAPYAPSGWEREQWRERMEWRDARREFRRQQREMAERRAYEAGRRDAFRDHRPWYDR